MFGNHSVLKKFRVNTCENNKNNNQENILNYTIGTHSGK